MFKIPPANWWEYHAQDCGTRYRGCAPGCPKDVYQETGKWTGPGFWARIMRWLLSAPRYF